MRLKLWVSIEHSWALSTKSQFHKVEAQWYNCIQLISKIGASYNTVDKKKKEKGMWFN